MRRLTGAVLPLVAALVGAHAAPAADLAGTLRVLHADDPAHGRTYDHYELVTAHGVVPLALQGTQAQALAGARVRVAGEAGADGLAPQTGGVQVLQAPALAPGTGVHRVAVIVFTGSWAAAAPDPQTARNVVFDGPGSVNAFYREESWGKLSLTGDVLGPYAIPAGDAGCDYESFAALADAAATAHGANLSSYEHVLYVFPHTPQCGWAGLAELPGTRTWVNGELDLRVIGHELGHNFGLNHASSESCRAPSGVRVQLSDACTHDEYGDPFDNMGLAAEGVHQLNAWHKEEAGWIGPDAVQTVSGPGTYNVAPIEQDVNGPLALRIPRPGRGDSLWLDFRQPSGAFDSYAANATVVNGVLVHLQPDVDDMAQSHLLDATPSTATFDDAAVTVGQSLTDPASGIRVTTLSVSPLGATVRVSMGATPDAAPPSTPTGLRASRTASGVALTWLPSTDDVAVAGYDVYRDGSSTPLGAPVVTSFVDAAGGAGAHSYTVRAFDGAGNLGDLSTPVSIAAAAPGGPAAGAGAGPSAPSGLRARLRVRHGRLVADLQWLPVRGAAAYMVIRDGRPVGQVTRLRYTDTRLGKLGPHDRVRYAVRALDGTGVPSGVSAAATVRRTAAPRLHLAAHTVHRTPGRRHLQATVQAADVVAPAHCTYRVGTGTWRACSLSFGGQARVAGAAPGTAGPLPLSVRVVNGDGHRRDATFLVS